MLDYHKAKKADLTIAVMPVPQEEAGRFGIIVSDENGRVREFQEKPAQPRSNLASMGIYIFSWEVLKEALLSLAEQPACDFGKHIIPYCFDEGRTIVSYEFNGYWKDVGTLGAYWEANMELIDIIPDFNLYEEFWKVYTKNDVIPPQFISANSFITRALIGDGTEIFGTIENSIIGSGVVVERGAVVRDSILMQGVHVGEGAVLERSIVAENCVIGDHSVLGIGNDAPNRTKPEVYSYGLAVLGENTVIPPGVKIGKNTAVTGVTTPEDYPDGRLESGETLDKAGVVS